MLDMHDPANIKQWLSAIKANNPQNWKDKILGLTNDMRYSDHQRYLIREAAAQLIREEPAQK